MKTFLVLISIFLPAMGMQDMQLKILAKKQSTAQNMTAEQALKCYSEHYAPLNLSRTPTLPSLETIELENAKFQFILGQLNAQEIEAFKLNAASDFGGLCLLKATIGNQPLSSQEENAHDRYLRRLNRISKRLKKRLEPIRKPQS